MGKCSLWLSAMPAVFVLCALFVQSGNAEDAKVAELTEFVRVSKDGWNFETVPGGKRFVPFGSNMVFHYPGSSTGNGIFILTQEKWDPETIRKVFEGARALNMNVMKVFLTSSHVLPDPQTNEKVTFGTMEPPLLDRLDYVFSVARKTNVYVSLTFAEWGMWSLKWWQEGGTFIGRQLRDGPGIDSFAVFRNFWKALARRYKDEPALFSYNFAVEFYLPGGNWGAQKTKKQGFVLNDRWGLPAWRAWLRDQYKDIAALNKAWGTAHRAFDEIEQPELEWADGAYKAPQATIADYGGFKEWVTYRFLKNQADAVRSIDTRHMITCGFHPHHPAIMWQGTARHLAGLPPHELDFLDYVTAHLYTSPPDHDPDGDPKVVTRSLRGAIITARFCYAGKPIIVEEMGHFTKDLDKTAEGTINLVKALRGHVSGFMLWCLSEIGDESPFGPLGLDLKPNSFGRAWAKLADPGGLVATLPTERPKAQTVFKLDRLNGLAPIELTEAQKLWTTWDETPQPIDFEWPLNPAIRKLRGH